jgi:hypothetical protein
MQQILEKAAPKRRIWEIPHANTSSQKSFKQKNIF